MPPKPNSKEPPAKAVVLTDAATREVSEMTELLETDLDGMVVDLEGKPIKRMAEQYACTRSDAMRLLVLKASEGCLTDTIVKALGTDPLPLTFLELTMAGGRNGQGGALKAIANAVNSHLLVPHIWSGGQLSGPMVQRILVDGLATYEASEKTALSATGGGEDDHKSASDQQAFANTSPLAQAWSQVGNRIVQFREAVQGEKEADCKEKKEQELDDQAGTAAAMQGRRSKSKNSSPRFYAEDEDEDEDETQTNLATKFTTPAKKEEKGKGKAPPVRRGNSATRTPHEGIMSLVKRGLDAQAETGDKRHADVEIARIQAAQQQQEAARRHERELREDQLRADERKANQVMMAGVMGLLQTVLAANSSGGESRAAALQDALDGQSAALAAAGASKRQRSFGSNFRPVELARGIDAEAAAGGSGAGPSGSGDGGGGGGDGGGMREHVTGSFSDDVGH
jgi:hypothetical protein